MGLEHGLGGSLMWLTSFHLNLFLKIVPEFVLSGQGKGFYEDIHFSPKTGVIASLWASERL